MAAHNDIFDTDLKALFGEDDGPAPFGDDLFGEDHWLAVEKMRPADNPAEDSSATGGSGGSVDDCDSSSDTRGSSRASFTPRDDDKEQGEFELVWMPAQPLATARTRTASLDEYCEEPHLREARKTVFGEGQGGCNFYLQVR